MEKLEKDEKKSLSPIMPYEEEKKKRKKVDEDIPWLVITLTSCSFPARRLTDELEIIL